MLQASDQMCPALALHTTTQLPSRCSHCLGPSSTVFACLTQPQCTTRLHSVHGAHAGAMERFVSSPAERGALVGGIAAECERAAQLDWAIELYLYAGQAGAALALINDQLSNALQPALSSSALGRLFCSSPQAFVSWNHKKS